MKLIGKARKRKAETINKKITLNDYIYTGSPTANSLEDVIAYKVGDYITTKYEEAVREQQRTLARIEPIYKGYLLNNI